MTMRILVYIIFFTYSCSLLYASPYKNERFDISPFAIPNCATGEMRFEEPRDINRIIITYAKKPSAGLSVSYLQKSWPQKRIERDFTSTDKSMRFGWFPIDDQFNSKWQKAQVLINPIGEKTVEITFQGLSREFPDCTDYDVIFRRTLGLRLDTENKQKIEKIEIYTTSQPISTTLRVQLNAGVKTSGDRVNLSGFNAQIEKITAISGVTIEDRSIRFNPSKNRSFRIVVRHMKQTLKFGGDGGMLTFESTDDAFTISLDSLLNEGPIWYAEEGVYITKSDDPTTFEQYKASIAEQRTISDQVINSREQSLGGAMNGQPKPHPDAFNIGCKNTRQRFRIEPNGDVLVKLTNMIWVPAKDTPRFKNKGNGRFFFGLEDWITTGRFSDPAAVPVSNIHLLRDGIELEQKILTIPLEKKISDKLAGDDTIVALVRFRFRNSGPTAVVIRLPISYSQDSGFNFNRYEVGGHQGTKSDDYLVPLSPKDHLTVEPAGENTSYRTITSIWNGQKVVRCTANSSMQAKNTEKGPIFQKELQPGDTCELLLKIPYIALDTPDEFTALSKLEFDPAYKQVREFWAEQYARGAQVNTPEPRLNALYKGHMANVMIADFSMPDDPYLINTSVGTSIYPNYANESCMIIQELDERGLHDEARRRLSVWLKYQGTLGLKGNFSDFNGVFYAAGGYQKGETYNQHHGWVLWGLTEHYFLTGDDIWLNSIADQLIQGADWVFRQRRLTMTKLPNSRGWEYGFLPAGSLEDVSDYFYWLSTNALTWRGVDRTAQALEAISHPDAPRIRKEADAYRKDLIAGFEKMRQNTPLVRLKNGKWAPNYTSRLYLRGRDVGWVREVLEGSIYLITSGLYDPNSKQAQWILDDYQDNRYINPMYGYRIPNILQDNWYDLGGFSCQPNLLAGLMPYLDRDEPEVYIWMFFNAWASCYREEVNAMVEHPQPIMGFSNSAIVKTSDESNAIKWLRYMFVYAPDDTLWLGKAIPREWFSEGREIWAEDVSTRFGEASVRYKSDADQGKISLTADLPSKRPPTKIIARIRHPKNQPIKSVTINGRDFSKFNPLKGDIDLTGLTGKIEVAAHY